MTADLLVRPAEEDAPRAEFDHLSELALAAVAHPGGHPWRLTPIDGGVQIVANGLVGSAVSDVGARTIRLSAGAALATMRLGIAALGRRPAVCLPPPTVGSTVLAVLRHGAPAAPTPMERALAGTVASVAAHLPAVGDRPPPAGLLLRARAVVEAEGLWVRTVEDPHRERLARLDARIADLPDAARLMAVGGNHGVPVEHIRAGSAVQNLVLTVRMLGGAVVIVGRPTDVAAWTCKGALRGFRGPHPYAVLAVSGSVARGWRPFR